MVGINSRSSFFSGSVKEDQMLLILRGFCAGSRFGRQCEYQKSDANNIGLTLELDPSFGSNRWNLMQVTFSSWPASSAMVMQVSTPHVCHRRPAFALQAIKGVVVILLSSCTRNRSELFQKIAANGKRLAMLQQ